MDPMRLDDCVAAAASQLDEEGIDGPAVLFLLGTGTGTLPTELLGAQQTLLGSLQGTPAIWAEAVLHTGRLHGAPVWMIEDAPGNHEFGEGDGPEHPAWERAFPVWLSAEMGARLCLFTAAGGSLQEDLRAGQLSVLTDHINLSGSTPLSGLGQTRLGPLFPDQSELHHGGLRAGAREHAAQLGISLTPCIAACVQGPALTTPAERRWYALTGAGLFAQGIAGPLIACAHAGLTSLSLIAITDGVTDSTDSATRGDSEPLDMASLVASAERAAPALEDLIKALMPELLAVASEREAEYS